MPVKDTASAKAQRQEWALSLWLGTAESTLPCEPRHQSQYLPLSFGPARSLARRSCSVSILHAQQRSQAGGEVGAARRRREITFFSFLLVTGCWQPLREPSVEDC